MNYDLIINWPELKRSLKLKITDRKMDVHGQHGRATILKDDDGESWLIKIFSKVIDTESRELFLLDVDIERNPDEIRDRLHLWRVLNEHTASRLAAKLGLTVPETVLITSSRISHFTLEPETELVLPDDVIILDKEDGGPDTAEEFYKLSSRENHTIETSEAFEDFLGRFSDNGDPSHVLGILVKYVPDTMNLDAFLDSRDFNEARKSIGNLDSGYELLPFDVWLNDPDRNQGNYLIKMDSNNNPVEVYGLDYEMWSFADDIWMDEDEITKGRSYLTAVIHDNCTIFDPRLMETIFRISSISNEELASLTLAPRILCQFIEYHVRNSLLEADERIKLLNIEQNLWDFLYETKPKLDKLTRRIIRQIGLPDGLKELEKVIISGEDDND
ncbi:MAG: hypothetical protein ACFFD4_16400 [Candidatus Odinarchaeota archaeon]